MILGFIVLPLVSFWNHALVCLFLLFSFSCVFFPICVFPFITSPVLFHPPYLTCSWSPHQCPCVYSLCSPSCVCQSIPWCFPVTSVLVCLSGVATWHPAPVSFQCLLTSPVLVCFWFWFLVSPLLSLALCLSCFLPHCFWSLTHFCFF